MTGTSQDGEYFPPASKSKGSSGKKRKYKRKARRNRKYTDTNGKDELKRNRKGLFTSHLVPIVDDTTEKPECTCMICGETFENIELFTKHVISHTNQLYQCLECGETLENREALSQHTQTHHPGQQTFRCRDCLKTFNHQSKLRQHMWTHEHKWTSSQARNFPEEGKGKSTSYKCNVCDRFFKKELHYRLHLRIHPNHEEKRKRKRTDVNDLPQPSKRQKISPSYTTYPTKNPVKDPFLLAPPKTVTACPTCPKKHPLRLYSVLRLQPLTQFMVCDCCSSRMETQCLSCRKCDFDICMQCASNSARYFRAQTPSLTQTPQKSPETAGAFNIASLFLQAHEKLEQEKIQTIPEPMFIPKTLLNTLSVLPDNVPKAMELSGSFPMIKPRYLSRQRSRMRNPRPNPARPLTRALLYNLPPPTILLPQNVPSNISKSTGPLREVSAAHEALLKNEKIESFIDPKVENILGLGSAINW